MDEPSMPKPSSNDDSEKCSMGNETWCQSPGRSVKRRSSSLAPFFLANSRTAFGSALVSAIQIASLSIAKNRFALSPVWEKVAFLKPCSFENVGLKPGHTHSARPLFIITAVPAETGIDCFYGGN